MLRTRHLPVVLGNQDPVLLGTPRTVQFSSALVPHATATTNTESVTLTPTAMCNV